jgi:protein SCO1/2
MKRVRILLWVAVAIAAVALFAARQLDDRERTEKGDFGRVPAFALTDQRGETITERSLLGRPWVANFVFTRCASVCPLLTAKFKAFQANVGPLPNVRYVSISVDPEHDSPEVLATYAAKYGADPSRWLFLTGPLTSIEKTVVDGFKIHMGKPTPDQNDPSLVDIMHGEHFVLVDRAGVIRGYYRSEPAELEELSRDLQALAAEGDTRTAHSRSPAEAPSASMVRSPAQATRASARP